MSEEGIISYDLQLRPARPLSWERLQVLDGWRQILYLLGLIGRDPTRYGGFAFGNISRRLLSATPADSRRPFVISGSQTGGLARLSAKHYVTVVHCCPEKALVLAEGQLPPSAEALTHAALYHADDRVRYVMHVHCPELWHRAGALGIAQTDAAAAGGTVALAQAISDLLEEPAVRRQGIFAMGGHEDGLVAFGRSAQEAAFALTGLLAQSRMVNGENDGGTTHPAGR
jgi:ribulose-5-phosphate 4-epimerase/fuculose-1-phosphate aldolase